MVGDTIHDSDVARAMDIECILVEHGHVSKDRLLKTGRKVVPNFEELLKELFSEKMSGFLDRNKSFHKNFYLRLRDNCF